MRKAARMTDKTKDSAAKNKGPRRGKSLVFLGGIVALAAVVTFGLVGLLVSIFEHKQDAKNPVFLVVEDRKSVG